MNYIGSRDGKKVSCVQAILNPFDEKKGLYIPEQFGKLDMNSLIDLDYPHLAFEVLKDYFDEFEQDDLKKAINKAYDQDNFKNRIVDFKLFDEYGYLELFHGATYAFKDMALALYPYLIKMAAQVNKIDKDIYIITATSGDTGKAALEAVKDLEGIKIAVLYPNNGVSKIQYEQMVKQEGNNVEVIAIDGNFDDAQSYVKGLFNDLENIKNFNNLGYHLMSANSINIARLLPQVVYYVYAYLELVREQKIKMNDVIDISVPTGNFGNILAAYIAKQMGVKIDKLICSCNSNNVLYDFFEDGVYDINNRKLYNSVAPSMDILISSNLERLLALKFGIKQNKVWMDELEENKKFAIDAAKLKELNEDFIAEYGSDEQALQSIYQEYNRHNYIVDPHTALALRGIRKAKNYGLVISSASPFKFKDDVIKALKLSDGTNEQLSELIKGPIPENIMVLKDKEVRFNVVLKCVDVAPYLLAKLNANAKKTFEVTIPATTANIGAGFDTMGIALALYNKFIFSYEKGFSIDSGNKKYNNKNNMVYQTYEKIMKKYNREVNGVFNLKIESQVPIARGLGSSSTCILAGIVAANIYGQLNLTAQQIAYEACLIEGHPDNVAPAALGGMVSAVLDDESIYYHQVKVSQDLKFYALIGLDELETSKARAALPKELSYAQAIYNISRASICLNAFEKGIIEYLPVVTQDKIHQEYRMNLIRNIDQIRGVIDSGNFITHWVSGAGTTMMFLAQENNENEVNLQISEYPDLDFRKLEVDYNGVVVKYL